MYVYNKGVVLCLQVLQVHSSARQQRILAVDSQARQLSMPIDYPIEVNVLQQNDRGTTAVDQCHAVTYVHVRVHVHTCTCIHAHVHVHVHV